MAAQTQYIVSGNIQDSSSEPLYGAHVKLTDSRQMSRWVGVATDENGAFSLSVPKGNYTLEVSFLGYATYTAHVEVEKAMKLPVIRLAEESRQLDAVMVTARTLTYNANGYVAEISKNPFYREHTMDDILKLTPGTYTSANSVEVYGKGVSKVYLNGRELRLSGTDLIEYLKTIDGKNVKQLEVVAASGVEEDAASAGNSIIRITTFRQDRGGMLNANVAYANGKTAEQVTPGLNLQWRMSEKWSSYAMLSGATGEEDEERKSETRFYDTDIRRTDIMRNRGKLHGYFRVALGLSYDWDKNNLFSIEGTFNTRHRSENVANTTSERIGALADYVERAEGGINRDRKYRNMNLSFAYTHHFSSQSELTFKADRLENDTENEEVSSYHYAGNDDTRHEDDNTEDNLVHTLRADFTQKYSALGGKLSAGAKYSHLSNRIHTDYRVYLNGEADEQGSYTDRYGYTENIYALYAKYSFAIRKFSVTAGLRMEHARLAPNSSVNPERNHTSHYIDFFPEAGVSYALHKEKGHHVSLNYNRGVNRPYLGDLNPLVIRQGEYSYNMGNPFLKPFFTDHVSLTTTWFDKYILRLAYNRSKDGVITLTETMDGILYTSPTNGSRGHSVSVYAGVPVRLGNWGNLHFTARYSYGESRYLEDRSRSSYWSFSYSGMFRLPAHINVMTDFSYRLPYESLYGKSYNRPYANIRVNKIFPKQGLTLGLTLGDLFGEFGYRKTESFFDSHYQVSEGTRHSFKLLMTVRYNLRWGQKSDVRRGSSGNSEESGRLSSQ